MELTRRGFLGAVPGACAAPAFLGVPAGRPDPDALWPEFPRQRPELAREMVGVCHRDVDRARAMLDEHPSLVNATWDWGFGDWETALGAAAHTGRRNIAEMLLSRGARLDIYAAAMLGQTDTVKAMIAAAPGIQRSPGPHGITLLAHARAGGDAAAPTAAFLESLGDADTRPPTQPLADEQRNACLGRYTSPALGEGAAEVGTNSRGDLTIAINSQSPIALRYAGDHAFFPAGAPAVRINFTAAGPGVRSLTIFDHGPVLTATRVP
jgi:hypothetical protein